MLRLLPTRRRWVHELWLPVQHERGMESINSKPPFVGLRDLLDILLLRMTGKSSTGHVACLIFAYEWSIAIGVTILMIHASHRSSMCFGTRPLPRLVIRSCTKRDILGPLTSFLKLVTIALLSPQFAHGNYLTTGALNFEVMTRPTYDMLSPDDTSVTFSTPCHTLRP